MWQIKSKNRISARFRQIRIKDFIFPFIHFHYMTVSFKPRSLNPSLTRRKNRIRLYLVNNSNPLFLSRPFRGMCWASLISNAACIHSLGGWILSDLDVRDVEYTLLLFFFFFYLPRAQPHEYLLFFLLFLFFRFYYDCN